AASSSRTELGNNATITVNGASAHAVYATNATVNLGENAAISVILYNDIYNWDNEPSTNTLEVHIHNLRDKVGKSRIRTVRGFGY
ncbi:winged helix-turn-helix domain-containing protein, partial [Salmonella enterica subsp. enterica serovar Montevideo]|nr:winged helix-turn-helix domain-containing protein [Salmonella enterica subsp. enterica serovar Montevideo]